jgi:hypothetical protein
MKGKGVIRMKRKITAVLATTALALGVAGPASAAQTDQDGLVNVAVVDVLNNNNVLANVQVPIGIAANVCGVNANVLAQQRKTGDATCNAGAQGVADAQNIIANLPPGLQ